MTPSQTLTPTRLTVEDIGWTGSDPPEPPEAIPGLLLDGLDRDELLEFAKDAQADLESLRLVLHEAVAALATVTHERDRIRLALRSTRR